MRQVAESGLTTAEALALFDKLAPVEPDSLHGFWAGEGCPTGHPLDGLLEACGWAGKRFEARGTVQPLLFRGSDGTVFAVRPVASRAAVGALLRWPALNRPALVHLVRWMLPVLSTREPQATLEMTEWRGQRSATIVYRHAPIRDVLRRESAGRLMGLMVMEGMPQPYFFWLRREG